MNSTQLETEIAARLQALVDAGVEVDILAQPEVEAEYQRTVQKRRVTIGYSKSEFASVSSTAQIRQVETIYIEVAVQARKLRGEGGLYELQKAVRVLLVGFKPTHCEKMYMHSMDFVDFKDQVWTRNLMFRCDTLVVEDSEPETGPLITQITIDENPDNPGAVVVPPPDTFPPNPPSAQIGDVSYWNGEVWVRLHPGEPGQVLTTNGAGQAPSWETVEGGDGCEGCTVWYRGADEPDSALGADGDFYLRTNGDYYQKESGAWELAGSLKGQDGLSAYEVAVANGFVGTEAQWLASLVGSAGANGWTPVLAVVSDGARRVQQVVDWTGGAGTKPSTGLYVGASGLVADIADGVNIRGEAGSNGTNGWVPVLAIITDGSRRVHQVIDWTGGTGTKPTTGLFVGVTGLVSNIADAIDIRGPQGIPGVGANTYLVGRLSGLTIVSLPVANTQYFGGSIPIPANTFQHGDILWFMVRAAKDEAGSSARSIVAKVHTSTPSTAGVDIALYNAASSGNRYTLPLGRRFHVETNGLLGLLETVSAVNEDITTNFAVGNLITVKTIDWTIDQFLNICFSSPSNAVTVSLYTIEIWRLRP